MCISKSYVVYIYLSLSFTKKLYYIIYSIIHTIYTTYWHILNLLCFIYCMIQYCMCINTHIHRSIHPSIYLQLCLNWFFTQTFPVFSILALYLGQGENLVYEHQELNKNIHCRIIFNSKKSKQSIHAYTQTQNKQTTGRHSNICFSFSFTFSSVHTYLDFQFFSSLKYMALFSCCINIILGTVILTSRHHTSH